VALTVVRLWGSSLRGRAPEEISGARFSASAWVWPVITAEPPLMPWLHWTVEATGGWLMTTASRVMAIWRLGSLGSVVQAALPVSSSKRLPPRPLKLSWVSHSPVVTPLWPVVASWGRAEEMSVPPRATLPSSSLGELALGRSWPASSRAHRTTSSLSGLSAAA
jgi:hypothetical protein